MAVLSLAGCQSDPLQPAPQSGFGASTSDCRVSKVVDGDTLHVTCGGVTHRVRLLGFDAPEIFHPHCAAEKTMGEQARRKMAVLVARGPVTLVQVQGLDRYGRDLAHVSVAGQDLSDQMLATGLARPYFGHRHPDWCGIAAG